LEAFDYAAVRSVDEAVSLLAQHGDQARPLAGGTDIIVAVREGRRRVAMLVDIKGIPEVNQLSYDPAQGLTLGAAVPCYRIYEHQEIAATYPGLIDAVSLVGGTAIQGRASVGGNLCNASPAADTTPALIVHGASSPAPMAGGRFRRSSSARGQDAQPYKTVNSSLRSGCHHRRLTSGLSTCVSSRAMRWTSPWSESAPRWC
jgi:CO/xanthine dehydrogenase FAD-binding subunit